MSKCLLTTIDNPYNPFDDFVNWYLYDETELKYHTCSYIARLCGDTKDATEEEEEAIIEEAYDKIILNDFLGIYVKVFENEEKAAENSVSDKKKA